MPVCSQCAAPRAPSLRPSAGSLVSRLVADLHSAIFDRRRARALSAAFGSGGMSHTNDLKRRRSQLQRSWSSFAHRAPSVFAVRTSFRRQCSRSRAAWTLVLARVACAVAGLSRRSSRPTTTKTIDSDYPRDAYVSPPVVWGASPTAVAPQPREACRRCSKLLPSAHPPSS